MAASMAKMSQASPESGEFVDVPHELDVSDDETDGHKHAKLLQAIGSIGGKNKATVYQRTEPIVKASEFNLAPGAGKVNLQDLIGVLKNNASHKDVKKQLGKIQANKKTLGTPLPKNEVEKIQRSVAYDGTKTEISKWDPIVSKNRKAEQLQFPLVKPDVKLRTTTQVFRGSKPRTPLEIEIASLLAGSKSVASVKKELTPAEEQALKAMSIEEAKERRAELQKYRALLTYKEAKARRQKKIKSKRFHRILRKERQKVEKKELDTLMEKDPEAHADMLMKLNKDRMEERMSLKHRGGSKFMKRQAIYGKFDDKGKQAVADMLEKHQQLRQKLKEEEDSSDDDGEEDDDDDDENTELAMRVTPSGESVGEAKNPWMTNQQNIGAKTYARLPEIRNPDVNQGDDDESESEDEDEESDEKMSENEGDTNLTVDEIFNKSDRRMKQKAQENLDKKKEEITRKRQERKAKLESKREAKEQKQKGKKVAAESSDSSDSDSDEQSDMDDEDETTQKQETGLSASLTRKRTLEDFDDMSGDEDEIKASGPPVATPSQTNKSVKHTGPQVDPKNFLTVSTRLAGTSAPELIGDSGEVEEEQEDQQMLTIAQAFASDDVVEEFSLDKAAAVEKDKPKDIDLTLPGWGSWGGTGIQPSARKRRRFTIKAPQAPHRRDSGRKGVIISETKDTSIAKHQVKQLPFPFTSVHQYQSSVRAPIGKTWNTENSYRKLIQPKVVTRMGTIIDPIDKSHVFKKDNNKQIPDNSSQDSRASNKKPRKGGNQQKKKKN